MSYLVNKIIQSMVFKGKKLNRKFRPQVFIDKERSIQVEGIPLKVKLTAKDFFSIREKLDYKERSKFVGEDDSIAWCYRNMAGSITKTLLDK